MRILVIDNDHTILELLKDYLSLKGVSVFIASNGREALELLGRESFDIVITDCDMPGITGIELTTFIRSMSPDSLIIGISGDNREKDFLNAGADYFILKPFSLSEIAKVIIRL